MNNPAYRLMLLIARLARLKDRMQVQALFIDGMREISGNKTCQWCDQLPAGGSTNIEICTANSSFGYFSYLTENDGHLDNVLVQNACQMIAVILEKLLQEQGLEQLVSKRTAELEAANRELEASRQLIENAQRTDKLESIGLLAGGIANDFNNLFSGVFGYIDLALDNTNDPSVSKYLEKALDVFNRARDLTHQLVTFSKGGAPIRKNDDIGRYIRESVLFTLSGSGIACEFFIAEDLNECDFNENEIRQVVDNVVINAMQAMTSGGALRVEIRNVTLTIENRVSLQEGDYIVVSISDTGIGIPPSIINRIFDPFFSTKKNGSGLGLATCFSIVKKHDGIVHVESELGKGSTFFIYLPSKRYITRSAKVAPIVNHTGDGLVVIMDDEEFILDILDQMLTDMGYEVVQTRSGEELLGKIDELEQAGRTIKACILDLTIPGGMGGRHAVKKLREKDPVLPLFASSGYSEDPVMTSPGQFGFTASICKPYRKFELASLLNSFFGESGTVPASQKIPFRAT